MIAKRLFAGFIYINFTNIQLGILLSKEAELWNFNFSGREEPGNNAIEHFEIDKRF